MQRFPCPFCGVRDETEFHFAVEAGKSRPEPAQVITDADWANYLYYNKTPKGASREIWMHITCGEYFMLERDTVTRDVIATSQLPEPAK